MTTLREAAQQALEALEWHYRQGHSNTLGGLRLKIDEKALRNLRAALAQQAEPVSADPHTTTLRNLLECCLSWERDACVLGTVTARQAVAALRAALAQQAEPKGGGNLPPPLQAERVQEPDLSRCPQCGGIADNGHDRSIPPNPYFCTKCMEQPAPEPEGLDWRYTARIGYVVKPYTTPPQRKPLTEEEILKAIGWERAEMYMKLTPNFPIEEARKETIKNARAIERAHGIKG